MKHKERQVGHHIAKTKKDPYVSAVRDFVKETIIDPDFFNLSPEEQKKRAMSQIQKHKTNANTNENNPSNES